MPDLAVDELRQMKESVFFDGPGRGRKLSRYWLLLSLAAVIAAAGVAADSTGTVIGAMIVAPLMTPILGTMLAVVLGDRGNLARSLLLVLAGAAAVVALGFLAGLVIPQAIVAETNTQVAARVHPRLADLVAAIATGAVGSVALARRDIGDTLPGVAIAISLVPPLSVVGLTLASSAPDEALGALLLFTTNVAAILATGTMVMALYGVHRTAPEPGAKTLSRVPALLVIAVLLVAVGSALTQSSLTIMRDTGREGELRTAAVDWEDETGWDLVNVSTQAGKVIARFEGPPPLPDITGLRRAIVDADVDPDLFTVELVPRVTVDLGGASTP
jgi:uncharacterized hydrophobic protein (TIGR00271 family)